MKQICVAINEVKMGYYMLDVQFREPTQEDAKFIISSWLSSTKKSLDKDIPHEVRHSVYRSMIQRCMESGASVIVACSIEEPDYIKGYVVYKDNVIHYCYVRFALRRQGLATALINAYGEIDVITHKPLWWSKAKPEIKKKFLYIPYYFLLGEKFEHKVTDSKFPTSGQSRE